MVYKKSTPHSILSEVYRYFGADPLLLGIFLSRKGVDKTYGQNVPYGLFYGLPVVNFVKML